MRSTLGRNAAVAFCLSSLLFYGQARVDASPRRRDTGPVISHRGGGAAISNSKAKIENLKVAEHGAEPTLGINPGGSIFYVAADLDGDQVGASRVPNQVHVLTSTDEGDSWEDVSPMLGPQRRHLVTLDPYLFVDNHPDGDTARIFTIDLTVACSYLSYSDDSGASWLTNPLACGRPVNDHQTLFAGPPVSSTTIGYPHVVYYCWNDLAMSSCTKSVDGGISFAPTGAPAYAQPSCGGLHGHGVVGHDGTILLPREFCGSPFLAISKDEGLSWKTVQVSKLAASPGGDPSVAVDDEGNISYLFISATDHLPYLTYSRDGGNKWSKPIMVGVPGLKEANLATLDAGDRGKVAIAYMGSTNVRITPSNDPDTPDERSYTNATWNAYLTSTRNVLAQNPTFVTAQVNQSSDPIDRGRCGPGRCGRVFDFIDVVVGPDGTSWGAFVDACIGTCLEDVDENEFGDEAFVGHLSL